ncbi:hypothetical protein E2C01_081038 [Portunus trituberculatus]|uniref:Uncharacterized protein n=1 Tax=Portunus trituberculatus TaxID=210409 RepID=A0A5B7IXM3_PORTR|nr:hypothetical protein [Portunus trituberculatus]
MREEFCYTTTFLNADPQATTTPFVTALLPIAVPIPSSLQISLSSYLCPKPTQLWSSMRSLFRPESALSWGSASITFSLDPSTSCPCNTCTSKDKH